MVIRWRSGLGVVAALGATLVVSGCGSGPAAQGSAVTSTASAEADQDLHQVQLDQQLADLEGAFGARLGLFAVDTATARIVEHRGDERFAMASTGKALSVAALLESTDDAELEAVVPVDAGALVAHSPLTEQHLGRGISLREAAEAAMTLSDNTAQNLVLDRIGGPEGLRAALRAVGDQTSAPARYEPDLNEVAPGDERDTSTARTMAATLQAYAVDGQLDGGDLDQFLAWMRASTTGVDLVRAGVPPGWDVGDKSGTASWYGGRNDLALIWPPGTPEDQPWVLAVMTDRPSAGKNAAPAAGLIAQATAVVVADLGEQGAG